MSEDLKAGDVVILNSGGPSMTLESIYDGNNGKRAKCAWFVEKKVERGSFDLTAVQKVKP